MRTGLGTYNPETGEVGGRYTYTEQVLAKGGSTGRYNRRKPVYRGLMNTSHIGDLFPTTDDFLVYQGRKYNITQVDPMYSGDTTCACKVRAESKKITTP